MGGKQVGLFTVMCVAVVVAFLGGCSTANVSGTAAPLFDVGQIAPMNLTASSTADGGWQMEIVTRGARLDEAVVVFTDGTTEVAELAGVTSATLTSDHTGMLACVMVKVLKDEYWYFDKEDYWYFDGAGQMMPASEGAQWYSGY